MKPASPSLPPILIPPPSFFLPSFFFRYFYHFSLSLRHHHRHHLSTFHFVPFPPLLPLFFLPRGFNGLSILIEARSSSTRNPDAYKISIDRAYARSNVSPNLSLDQIISQLPPLDYRLFIRDYAITFIAGGGGGAISWQGNEFPVSTTTIPCYRYRRCGTVGRETVSGMRRLRCSQRISYGINRRSNRRHASIALSGKLPIILQRHEFLNSQIAAQWKDSVDRDSVEGVQPSRVLFTFRAQMNGPSKPIFPKSIPAFPT